MENLVPRKEIYTGILKHIVLNEPVICRSMIFKLTKESLAEDLIYTTPTKYPLYNIEYDKNIDKSFYIDTILNMNDILKYLDFSEELSQNELNIVYKKFISHNWWIEHNAYLFKNELDMNTYNLLHKIGENKLGNPNIEEPEFAFIKRKQKDS